MNLRNIKKDIDYVLGAFIEDCATCVAVNPNANDESIAALMDEAVDLYNELRDKAASRNYDGNKKTYFNSLRKEILERTDALYSKLSSTVAGKAEKPAAKKAAPKAEKSAEEVKPAAKKAAPKAEGAEEKKPAAKKPAAKKAAPKAEGAEEKKPAAKKPAAKKAPAKKEE